QAQPEEPQQDERFHGMAQHIARPHDGDAPRSASPVTRCRAYSAEADLRVARSDCNRVAPDINTSDPYQNRRARRPGVASNDTGGNNFPSVPVIIRNLLVQARP